jgi:hypothetical protein
MTCVMMSFLPDLYTAYRSDRRCANEMRAGGALIVVSHGVGSFKRGCNLEIFDECVWVKNPARGLKLLLGNH